MSEMDSEYLYPMMTGTSYVAYDDYSLPTESPEESCQAEPVPHANIFLPLLYAIIFVVGIIGNSILIAALFRRGVQRLIDVFIVNLAASDFVFLITLPLWVDKEKSGGNWRSGSFLCKGSSYVISVNMYCSTLLLTCMSTDRYLAIMHPFVARKVRTRFNSIGMCICVWVLSSFLGLPILLTRQLVLDKETGTSHCTDSDLMPMRWITSLIILILAFFFPLLCILTFYCSVTRKLCMHYQKSGKHDKKLRKSIKIVFIVVAAFVFSWIPFNLFKLLAIISQLLGPNLLCLPYKVALVGMQVSGPLAFANSCANPFIYYFFDCYIRRAMMRCIYSQVKAHSVRSSSDTVDTRLSHSLSYFIYGEDATRKRRRSMSF
ncbi:G-protein coupled receptor 15 [Alligator mississippiensis]|uniref:G-protein coupled receptor 15 n=1 Tax=Alligator mississippiensis TaxID=8496 RepID=A0A151MCZ0_ALLMI|nr:G-protein coupled receptor 15 [Alligator mississippiensis]